jgi:hypothetical protein
MRRARERRADRLANAKVESVRWAENAFEAFPIVTRLSTTASGRQPILDRQNCSEINGEGRNRTVDTTIFSPSRKKAKT